jgi:diphthine synthase
MFYLIGLGLGDETDITVKGLEIVKKASRVYLEAYTSILLIDKGVLVCYSTLRKSTLTTSRKVTMAVKS